MIAPFIPPDRHRVSSKSAATKHPVFGFPLAIVLRPGEPESIEWVNIEFDNTEYIWLAKHEAPAGLGPHVEMAAFLSTHPSLSDVESPRILEACEAWFAYCERSGAVAVPSDALERDLTEIVEDGCEVGEPSEKINRRIRAALARAKGGSLAKDEAPAVDGPDELAVIGENIRTQDNRITSFPIFAVQQKRRIYGLDPEHTDYFIWVDDESDEVDEETSARLNAEFSQHGEVSGEYARVGYKDTWEFVTACFTEQGCKDYIAIDGHNLNEPRIYVYSAHRNYEWQRVRAALMEGKIL